MDILFAASELAPMVKVGGLADVVSALSKALRLLGHKVTIAIPRYPALETSGLMLARRLTPMVVPGLPGLPGLDRQGRLGLVRGAAQREEEYHSAQLTHRRTAGAEARAPKERYRPSGATP